MSPILTGALFLSVVAPAASAAAPEAATSGRPLSLAWQAPETCPDQAAVLGMVETYLGTPLGELTLAASPVIEAKLSQLEDQSFSLDLTLTSSSGTTQRSIQNPACEVLAKATALAAAMAVEVAVAEREELERLAAQAPPPKEPLPEPVPIEPDPPVAKPPEEEPVRVALAAHGAGEFGVLPKGGGGAMLRLAWLRDRFQLAARGEFFAGPPVPLRDTAATGTFQMWSAGIEGCAVLGNPKVAFPLCLHGQAGQIRGKADGVETSRVSRQVLASIGVGAWLVGYPVPRLGMRVGFEGAAHPHTPAFEIDQIVVHRVRVASVRALAGIEARF